MIIFESRKAYFLGPSTNTKSSTSSSSQPVHGHLRITSYRLIFTPFDSKSTSYVRKLVDSNVLHVPLFTMSKCKTSIRNNNGENFYLNVTCKDVRSLSFEIQTEWNVTAAKLDMIIKFYIFPFSAGGQINQIFPFASKKETEKERETSSSATKVKNEHSGWNVYDVEREALRLGNKNNQECKTWVATKLRLCRLNESYNLCKTYPAKMYAPSSANDQVVNGCASFRSKNRLPMFQYVHTNRTSLWRCSQPKVGLGKHRNQMDEMYLKEINNTNPNLNLQDKKDKNNKLYICDCRPYVNALANRGNGKSN